MTTSDLQVLVNAFPEFEQNMLANMLATCDNALDLAIECLQDIRDKLNTKRAREEPQLDVPLNKKPKQQEPKKAKKSFKHANDTCVTSHISFIAKDMFIRKMINITEAAEEAHQLQQQAMNNTNVHKEDTMTVAWHGMPIKHENGRTYYSAAIVDGELLELGDTVYMRTGDEEPWFAQIMSFFDSDDADFQFHARFFSHGKETVLKQLAGERELFLLDNCADNDLYSVMGKANVIRLDGDVEEPTTFTKKDWWFYRLWYDPEDAVFEDVNLHEDPDVCLSCAASEEQKAREHPEWGQDFVKYQGVEYHVHDFVYTLIGEESDPYVIGQIISIDASHQEINICIMDREESNLDHYALVDNASPQDYKDSRLLSKSTMQKSISCNELEGKCWVEVRQDVEDVKSFKQCTDNFYTHDAIIKCTKCQQDRAAHDQERQNFAKSMDKLRALDIFAGCGGFTVGMDDTGVVETTHSIEFNPDAAKTFQHNFPTSTVHNQCANVLLTRAIKVHQNLQVPPLDDFLDKPLEPMPQPGDIDFIYCGPPCQGFSDLNQHKKPNEIKNTLVCSAMSYVDFYRPSYFLLENVRGLVSYKLGEDKIESGVLKFIIRCLTSMGYQVRFAVLQAAQYGVAQKRRRLFVWGARIGKRLPQFPQPIHCSKKHANGTAINFTDGTQVYHVKRTGKRAPLPELTVGDTISDLPPFNYQHPNSSSSSIPTYDATNQNDPPGQCPQQYTKPPMTDLQTWLRGDNDCLYNHVTRAFNDINVERICTIKMEPNADHNTLPKELVPWALSRDNPAAKRHKYWPGLYGRLDYNQQFETAVTEVNPMSKQGTVIHPNQHRVLSVREAARSQGFPDWFVFKSTDKKPNSQVNAMYMQVGNAVPVPLAAALGNSLKDAMFEDWLQDH